MHPTCQVSSLTDEELDEFFEPGDVHAFVQCEPCSPKSPPSSPPSPTGAYDPTVADVCVHFCVRLLAQLTVTFGIAVSNGTFAVVSSATSSL